MQIILHGFSIFQGKNIKKENYVSASSTRELIYVLFPKRAFFLLGKVSITKKS